MIHFTVGTRQPYSIEALAIRLTPFATPMLSSRREADVLHQDERQHEHHAASTTPRRTKGTPRLVTWAM